MPLRPGREAEVSPQGSRRRAVEVVGRRGGPTVGSQSDGEDMLLVADAGFASSANARGGGRDDGVDDSGSVFMVADDVDRARSGII